MAANGDGGRLRGELMGPPAPPDTPMAHVVIAVVVDDSDDRARCDRCGAHIAVAATARRDLAGLPGPPAVVLLCGKCALVAARAWAASVDPKPLVRLWDVPEIARKRSIAPAPAPAPDTRANDTARLWVGLGVKLVFGFSARRPGTVRGVCVPQAHEVKH
jgi:hypothetical protein